MKGGLSQAGDTTHPTEVAKETRFAWGGSVSVAPHSPVPKGNLSVLSGSSAPPCFPLRVSP